MRPTRESFGRTTMRKAEKGIVLATYSQEQSQALTAWALVELFGHQRIVGKVTVDPVDFRGTVRVDVTDLFKDGEVKRKGFTRYFGRGALYAVNPITEQAIRELLLHVDGQPARPLGIAS